MAEKPIDCKFPQFTICNRQKSASWSFQLYDDDDYNGHDDEEDDYDGDDDGDDHDDDGDDDDDDDYDDGDDDDNNDDVDDDDNDNDDSFTALWGVKINEDPRLVEHYGPDQRKTE